MTLWSSPRLTPRADTEAERVESVRVVRGVVDLPWLPKTELISRTASANHAMVKLGAHLPDTLDGWRPDVVHGHDWRMGWAADAPVVDFLGCRSFSRCTAPNRSPRRAAADGNAIRCQLH